MGPEDARTRWAGSLSVIAGAAVFVSLAFPWFSLSGPRGYSTLTYEGAGMPAAGLVAMFVLATGCVIAGSVVAKRGPGRAASALFWLLLGLGLTGLWNWFALEARIGVALQRAMDEGLTQASLLRETGAWVNVAASLLTMGIAGLLAVASARPQPNAGGVSEEVD